VVPGIEYRKKFVDLGQDMPLKQACLISVCRCEKIDWIFELIVD
jgi:hypothetical protein